MMIFFRTEAIFASSISKFGNLRPPIDCDVFRSSTESTISFSFDLQQSFRRKIRSLSSFSKTEMSKDWGIYRNAYPRLDSSVVQPCISADKLLLHEREEDSKLKAFFAYLGVGTAKC